MPETTAAKTITRLRDLKVDGGGHRDVFGLDPREIRIEKGHNPRNYQLHENRQHLDALKESIRTSGVLVPLLVRYEASTKEAILVDGECRLRATLELIEEGQPIKSVPAMQVPGNSEPDRLLTAIVANTGKPLSQWESGGAFKRLMAFGWSEADISQKTGFTERYVKQAVELSDAPEEVKQMLSEQAITPSLALASLRADGSNAGTVLKEKVVKAKQEGKTGPVVMPRKSPAATLKAAAAKLLDGLDLTDKTYAWVEVNRKLLVALKKALGE